MALFGPPDVNKLIRDHDVKGLVRALSYKSGSMNEEHFTIRKAAAQALGGMGDAAVIAPLAAALGDCRFEVGTAAMNALVVFGASSLPTLIPVLKDPNDFARRLACEALGCIRDPRAVEPLIYALRDSKPEVRAGAANALAEIGDSRAVEPLMVLLGKETTEGVRVAFAKALGELRDPRAVEILRWLLHMKSWVLEPEQNWAAFNALLKIGIPALEALLSAYAHSNNMISGSASKEVVRMGAPVVEPLIGFLHHRDVSLRTAAVRSLGWLRDLRAVDPLTAVMLEDPEKSVRTTAAEALRNIPAA